MAMRQFRSSQTITERNTISINNYLREINRYPMISMEEEVQLAQQIRMGGREAEQAKKRLVEANLRFVITVANQYRQKNMELSDLISEGNIGLIKAAERFDETRGFKFISYAVWWIRQSIIAAISAHGDMIRIPNNQQALIQQYHMLTQEVMQTEQRKPTVEEFAKFADISVEKAKNIINSITTTISIDTPIADDSDATIGDFLYSESKTDYIVEHESLHSDIVSLIDKALNPREKEIVTRFFGINHCQQTLEDISTDIGLSRERVRQIREKALSKIKAYDDSRLLYRYLG